MVAITLLLAALALTLALLGSSPTGNVGAGRLDMVTVSLASLRIFLVPLLALLLSHDAIAGEAERGTLLLLLAYPVGRGAVIRGKFLGQLAILAFATLFGYGAGAVAVGWGLGAGAEPPSPRCSAPRCCSAASSSPWASWSAPWCRERTTAGGIAIGLWLVFVILYEWPCSACSSRAAATACRRSWSTRCSPSTRPTSIACSPSAPAEPAASQASARSPGTLP